MANWCIHILTLDAKQGSGPFGPEAGEGAANQNRLAKLEFFCEERRQALCPDQDSEGK